MSALGRQREPLLVAVRSILGTTRRGGAVFSGLTPDDHTVRVVAAPDVLSRRPVPGEAWAVTGRFEDHYRYGRQLVAQSCQYQVPTGRLLIRYLADSVRFKGLGETKAMALWDKFGDRLGEILSSGAMEALESILAKPMAERLVEAWQEAKVEGELMTYLDAHGFDYRLATKLQRVWGDTARRMLDRNPYYLLAFTSWNKVDAAAGKLGLAPDDERRLVGAVESALYDRLQNTHTRTSRTELLTSVAHKLQGPDPSNAIELALLEGAATGGPTTGYQPIGAAALECGIANRIRRMLNGETPEQDTLFTSDLNECWADRLIEEVERNQGFALNDEQRLAAKLPFEQSFCLMTGGAGVGKTTVLRVVIRLAEKRNLKVFQMALAGRAAKRMSEATGHPATTIAKFLIEAKAERLGISADSLLVIDEASMLDLPMLYRILRHLPDGARVLLVGDPAQLAPIGFGLVFHRLVGNPRVPQVHLVKVHRQAESTGIPAAAKAVRVHTLPSFVPYGGHHPGVSFIQCEEAGVLAALDGVVAHWKGEDWQVLAGTKRGVAGINAINLHNHLSAPGALYAEYLVPGEPVIHLVNDYERGLMNGTLGRVASVEEDGRTYLLEFEGHMHRFDSTEIHERVDHAYAISIHKAQGSQFDRVAVVITKSRLLDHALIYTALTRGVKQVVFIGNRAAFDEAVHSQPNSMRREVGFQV